MFDKGKMSMQAYLGFGHREDFIAMLLFEALLQLLDLAQELIVLLWRHDELGGNDSLLIFHDILLGLLTGLECVLQVCIDIFAPFLQCLPRQTAAIFALTAVVSSEGCNV